MTPLGFNPLDEYQVYVKLHGFRDLFDQKQVQYASRFPSYVRPDFTTPYRSRSFRALREIVTTAAAHDLDLTLIVYPYHVWVMDLLRQNGLWNSFEAWKRAVVHVVADLDPSHRVRIVDFSGYNSYTTEQVPALGDTRSRVHWYWEPGHFRPSLGDRIIARLYDHQECKFGQNLTPVTVNRVIAHIRDEAALVSEAAERN